jgi:class 3 adenylate cyclase/tetratricopeptide (TPR) repeat protein
LGKKIIFTISHEYFQVGSIFQPMKAPNWQYEILRDWHKSVRLVCIFFLSFFSFQVLADQSWKNKVQNFSKKSDLVAKDGDFTLANALLDSALLLLPSEQTAEKSRILLKKAFLLQVKSEYSNALMALFEARQNFEKAGDSLGIAEVATNIGAIYHNLGDFAKAEEYYQTSLKIYQNKGSWQELARCYNNFGSLAEDKNQPREALAFHRKSMAIWKANRETSWQGISYMHLGVCHDKIGNADSALYYLEASANFLIKSGDLLTSSLVYSILGNTCQKMGKLNNAKYWCHKGLELAKSMLHVRYESKCIECLYKVYEALGRPNEALQFHKQYIQLRDSVFNEQKAKEITRMEMEYGFQQQRFADSLAEAKTRHFNELKFEKQLAKEQEKRNISIFTGILVLFFAVGLWSRLQYVRRSRQEVSAEKDRSEKLLLKVLPAQIAEELKNNGKTEGREHNNISVLFLDVENFTTVAQQMKPKELVEEIHTCFASFDAIIEKYGLEKIKTIGDSYMAAAGVPSPIENGAEQTIFAALEIQAFLESRNTEMKQRDKPAFKMRAGIHTGPVIAGVVGVNKFQYDIWGDTVNTASRMETSGEAGKVNISQVTFEQVKNNPKLKFKHRGVIEVKGKGLMEMYFVDLNG